MLLFLKIVVQILAVIVALYVNKLDYIDYDKRTVKFKFSRNLLFIFTFIFLFASIIFTILEDINNNKKEDAQKSELLKVQTQNEELQKQINRTANPIKDISISFNFTTPLNTSTGNVYRKRMLNNITTLSKQVDGLNQMGMVMGEGGYVHRLAITELPYIPDKQKEPAVFNSLNLTSVDIDFYKTPISIEELKNEPEYEKNLNYKPKANLRLKAAASITKATHNYFNSPNSGIQLIYELKEDVFTLTAHNLKPMILINDGKITTIPDLADSQMVIWIGQATWVGEENIKAEIKQVFRLYDIKDFIIEMSEGRKFELKRADFQLYSNKDGDYFYVCKFPNTD